jgi:phage FluMu protein Com
MPITFSCTCGKTLRVADEHAGRRIKCPACNAIGTAPKPEPEPVFEVVEPAPLPLPDEPDHTPTPAKPYRNPNAEYEEYDGTVYGLDKSGGRGSSGGDEKTSDPRDKELPDFRLGSGQRGKKRGRKKN